MSNSDSLDQFPCAYTGASDMSHASWVRVVMHARDAFQACAVTVFPLYFLVSDVLVQFTSLHEDK